MARNRKKKTSSNYGKYTSGDSGKPRNTSNGTSSTKASNDSNSDKNTMSGDKVTEKEPEAPSMDKGYPAARSANNDPEWYAKDAQLVIDAASLPYSEPLGDEIKLQTAGEVYGTDGVNPVCVAGSTVKGASMPGICTAFTKSSFGSNRYAQDAANVAANALYTHVRYVNSGRKNYDPADLFMYVASMADVYSYVMWCQRMYAKAFIYSQRNKYIGKALLAAENVDHSNLVNNLANFRYWLNTYINKVASFAVPASIAYFQRRAWMFAHVYIENDDTNIKDQLYQFAPDGFYRFDLDSAGAGMLQYKKISEIVGHSNALTLADIQTIGEWLIEKITGDEDFGLMSGDILKAFNGDIIGLASVPETIDIIPVYSEYVLLQFKNASIVDALRGTTTNYTYDTLSNGVKPAMGNVYQMPDGNILSLEGVSGINADAGDWVTIGMRKVLTVNTPTPTPIDTIEASRLTIGGYGILALTGEEPIIKASTGADIITHVSISTFEWSGADWICTIEDIAHQISSESYFCTNALTMSKMAQFKYTPMLYTMNIDNSNPRVVTNVKLRSNIANYTIVDWRVIARMHEVALLSMLWVPGVAKVVNY